MIASKILFFLAASVVHVARAVPTPLDANTLLQNGQAAQILNAEFQNLTITDACDAGQLACISGRRALCTTNGTWETARCSLGHQCFALPSVRENGTFLACTSEVNAESIISATGVQGGIFANSTQISNSTEVPFPSINATSTSTSNSSSTSTSASTSATSPADSNAVTLTITINPTGTVTVPTETFTIPPSAAASFISSVINAGGSASIVSTATDASVTSTVTSTGSTSSTIPADSSSASAVQTGIAAVVGIPVITLTSQAAPTATPATGY
ncbi:hypothetical protein JAAARDRAFT_32486 [Jaapia argillacea MUCL 33604]|uniref:Carbohydrate-binding module family 19 domain-containing protein n=1 Tax=Jaapia argillacea MUCL 33604 TaxID=933084 RepID=A0A067QBX9_9AGAM|nr:hypothetical protein JAAARDRAFT_32486 [Jaapia argillacea MUCL 33604]